MDFTNSSPKMNEPKECASWSERPQPKSGLTLSVDEASFEFISDLCSAFLPSLCFCWLQVSALHGSRPASACECVCEWDCDCKTLWAFVVKKNLKDEPADFREDILQNCKIKI